MPLYREWKTGPDALAAIWKMEESESFFKDSTGLFPDINNEKRRMEHLGGRHLLRWLKRDFPLQNIVRDEHNKPRLHGETFFFSVSHSWPWAAAIVNSQHDTGIDIQTWNPRIMAISAKFLSAEEADLCGGDDRLITLLWCAKEAAYKWYGKRGIVNFIQHLPVTRLMEDSGSYDAIISFQLAESPFDMHISGFLTEEFACAWVAQAGDI